MYVLHAPDLPSLDERSVLFARHMEPVLAEIEASYRQASPDSRLPEVVEYLEVCRWPFRQLEYSFALDALLPHAGPGRRCLDAGCGPAPFAHALAAHGAEVAGCDSDERLMRALAEQRARGIRGAQVNYTAQDLTAMSFPDGCFDAVSCISVLEHIPSPDDQRAVHELQRVLKPGGLLVLTVDFRPPSRGDSSGRLKEYAGRIGRLVRGGDVVGIARAAGRKWRAREAVKRGAARWPRSANQCFEVGHLEEDIYPVFRGDEVPSRLPFSRDLRSLTADDAKQFWDLRPGLWERQGRRPVLPVGVIIRKTAAS